MGELNESGAKSRTKGAIEAAGDKLRGVFGEDGQEQEREPARRKREEDR